MQIRCFHPSFLSAPPPPRSLNTYRFATNELKNGDPLDLYEVRELYVGVFDPIDDLMNDLNDVLKTPAVMQTLDRHDDNIFLYKLL